MIPLRRAGLLRAGCVAAAMLFSLPAAPQEAQPGFEVASIRRDVERVPGAIRDPRG